MSWEDDEERELDEEEDLEEEPVFIATAKGLILPLECVNCGSYFEGLNEEVLCPACREGDSVLEQLLANAEYQAAEDEADFFAYRCEEWQSKDGWLKTKVEKNINIPAPSWKDELHELMRRRGMLKPLGEGKWMYDYPTDLGDYMILLTTVSAACLRPFHQLCIMVRFWRSDYMYVNIPVFQDGKYKILHHNGKWSKWMKWGKEEIEVTFNPFNPITFLYFQPRNKGFRALIDEWKNVREGGVDALIKQATEVVFG